MDFITKYKLVKAPKVPYSTTKTLDVFDKLEDAIRWARQIYKENNGMFDTAVIECKYASAKKLENDFTFSSHYKWASYFNEVD